jgi:hypothetical protein
MNEFPIIRNYDDLVAVLVLQKNALGLSHSTLEHVCGLATGHADKVLGRAKTKSIGKWLFGILLEGLALELVPRVNPDALRRVQGRHTRRNEKQVRNSQPLSQEILARAAAELGRRGRVLQLARQAKRRQTNGHANGHAER